MSVWTQRATGSGADGRRPDLREVYRALAVLADPFAGVQLQAAPSWSYATFAGDDLDAMCEWVERHGDATGVYYALNPVPSGLARRVLVGDALRRRWLLVDVDRAKTAETLKLSATAAEHDAARGLANQIREYLAGLGWPAPLLVDSGNGFHLLYRIDLPNDEPSRLLVKGALSALGERFDGSRGSVGRECYDARRIAKLPGTWARKGPDTPDRPHRLARLLYAPEEPGVVTADQLAALAAAAAPKVNGSHYGSNDGPDERHHDAPPPNGAKWTGTASDTADRAYARAAFERACGQLALSGPGCLNADLYATAAAMGNFVGAGLLDEAEVFDTLLRIIRACGADAPRKDEDTLRRGIADGRTRPRGSPGAAGAKAGKSAQPTEEGRRYAVVLDGETLAEGTADEVIPEDQEEAGPKTCRVEMQTIGRILDTHYPEPSWIVKGLLSEGLNILAGAPKQGKSMLALNLSLTVAGGGLALGKEPVTPGDVLYLSLEDKERRVKFRAVKMLPGLPEVVTEDVRRRLTIATDWPRLSDGGLRLLEHWRRRADRPVLVIIDVWNRFCPPQRQGSTYHHDADAMSAVKRWADRHGITVLVLHHTRKPAVVREVGDFVHEISGTLGLSGTADGIMVLLRQRQDTQAAFHVTGRDWGESELVIQFDPDTFTWRSLGSAAEHVGGRVQTAVLTYLRGLGGHPAFCKDIAEMTGQKPDSVRQALNRLFREGMIRKAGNGWAFPGEMVGSEAI